jgi:hypothetical protein
MGGCFSTEAVCSPGVGSNLGAGPERTEGVPETGEAYGEARQVAGGGLQVSRRGGGDTDGLGATVCRGRGLGRAGLG